MIKIKVNRKSKISLATLILLSLLTPLAARADNALSYEKSKNYEGKYGKASAGASLSPVLNVNGNSVEYGTSYNTYTTAELSGKNGGSLSGSSSGSGYISASSSGSGSNQSNYTLTGAGGGSATVSTSGSTSFSSNGNSYQGNGNLTMSNGNTYSWSTNLGGNSASSPSGSVEISKNGNSVKTVTF